MTIYRLKLRFYSDNDFKVFGNKSLYSFDEMDMMEIDRYYTSLDKLNEEAIEIFKDIAKSVTYNDDRPYLNGIVDTFRECALKSISLFKAYKEVEYSYDLGNQDVLVRKQAIEVRSD